MAQHTVQVRGAVDFDSAGELANRLANAILYRDDDLVVDCSEAQLLDGAAVRVLAEATGLLEAEGRQLHLRA